MEIHVKKNEALELFFPMVDSVTPSTFKSGETVADTAYYEDGGGWQTLAIADTVTELNATGMYQLDLTQGEMNHNQIAIKLTAANSSDSMILIRTYAVDVDDLVRSTTPANALDINATGEAGIDWANIGNPTTAVDLSGTDIQLVDTATTATNAITTTEVFTEIENALDAAFTDATDLTANGLKERIRALLWIVRNKMAVTDANGNTIIYKDNGTTEAVNVAAAITDDTTTTIRERLA